MQPKNLYEGIVKHTPEGTVIVFNNEEEAASIMSILSYLRTNKQKLENLINEK